MTGKPRPDLNDTAATPYWEAAARRELVMRCCDACAMVFFPPSRLLSRLLERRALLADG